MSPSFMSILLVSVTMRGASTASASRAGSISTPRCAGLRGA
jgi:hypothetical protein